MAFACYICDESSNQICARCTKDVCGNHLCEKCRKCSDCCECEVVLEQPMRVNHASLENAPAAETPPEPGEPLPPPAAETPAQMETDPSGLVP